jgi:hypothetical protein
MSVRRMGGLVYLLDGRGAPRFIILGSTEMLPPSSCPRTIRACSATFRSMRKSVAASLGRAVGLVLDVHRPVAPVGLDADDIAVSSGVVARLPHGRVRWSGDGQDRLRPDLEGCPNKAIRHDCILKELQKLETTTVLTFLRGSAKDDLLTPPKPGEDRQPLTPGECRMLRKMGASDAEIVGAPRELACAGQNLGTR